MRLENQCVSLELAKQLKSLNVPQESIFYWWEDTIKDKHTQKPEICVGKPIFTKFHDYYSAFTCSELGEMLPENCRSWKNEQVWWCEDNNKTQIFGYDTEANCRAKMLIHLIENKLITI